jgi:hypothetical protein
MAKTSFVLHALRILGLEEMLKLSEVLQVKQIPLKKVAGDDLVTWDDEAGSLPKKAQPEAKVLEFPKERSFRPGPTSLDKEVETSEKSEDPSLNIYPSEILIWQRELGKDSGELLHKKDAVKGYKRATDMYVVKTQGLEGKETIRFATTNGVLVNKKQA